jgi:hypothetical protein
MATIVEDKKYSYEDSNMSYDLLLERYKNQKDYIVQYQNREKKIRELIAVQEESIEKGEMAKKVVNGFDVDIGRSAVVNEIKKIMNANIESFSRTKEETIKSTDLQEVPLMQETHQESETSCAYVIDEETFALLKTNPKEYYRILEKEEQY